MRLFAIHILIKDLSSLVAYLVILKFNLTNETYLPEMVSVFPGAPNMSIGDIITGALILSTIPLMASVLTYYPIYFGIKKNIWADNDCHLTDNSNVINIDNSIDVFNYGRNYSVGI